MTPEEKARVKIDRWFEDAGWGGHRPRPLYPGINCCCHTGGIA